MHPISEKDEDDDEEDGKKYQVITKESLKNKKLKKEVNDDKSKFYQAEITRLTKDNEELRYINETLTSNLERLQEEISDLQSNEEKFMMQVNISRLNLAEITL